MMSVAPKGKQKKPSKKAPVSFARSQLILFQSRKKFALLYCLATVTGLFCLPGVLGRLSSPDPDIIAIVQMTLPLPVASLLVTVGTYILNDLVDADLDKANGKKRPIPSGQVSKRQAGAFVALSFGGSILLTALTLRPISLIILASMLAIGITYSMPKIALMKKFVLKTLAIAIFYILCALLGIASAYNFDLAIENPLTVASMLLTLGLMVSISSTLNDMGDVDGDKAAGRRTTPIVIGERNTIKLTIGLAVSVLVITWACYAVALAAGHGSLFHAITTSSIVLIILTTLVKMRKGLHNSAFTRLQHKKLFPLQMAMHPSLMAGVIVI